MGFSMKKGQDLDPNGFKSRPVHLIARALTYVKLFHVVALARAIFTVEVSSHG
jgi:hypothetical protein